MSGLMPFRRRHALPEPSSFERFSDMFDDFFHNTWLPRRSLILENFKMDVQETDKEYRVEAEMPGIKKEEICVNLEDGRLTIAVKREKEVKEERKNYIHQERSVSSMERSVYLEYAKAEGITAKLADGVLEIVVPKVEKTEKPTQIVIE